MMSKRYNSMSIDKVDGKTYWHKSFESMEEVKAHCNRYVRKPCDILVYEYVLHEHPSQPIKFVEIWENFK